MKFETKLTRHGQVSYRKLGHGKRKILFFHGFPGSSTQIGIFKSIVLELDLEVICFDRPGYHHTTALSNNPMALSLEIAEDMVTFLKWEKFEIVTVSGGTPYGISYALKHPERVTATRVICGLGNLQLPDVKREFSPLAYLGLKVLPFISGSLVQILLKPNFKKRNKVIDFFLPPSKADFEVFQSSNVAESLTNSLVEALHQKGLGLKLDAQVFLSHWTLPFQNFDIPIHFWHGDEDTVISPKVTTMMAQKFPKGDYTLVKKEGHISLPVRTIRQILELPIST